MADEAVIRVVVQGSKGATTGGAEGAARSDPDLQRSISASEKNTAQSATLTRATAEMSASLTRLERRLSEPASGGGASGIAGKVMSGILNALAKTADTALSLPMDLVKDYGRTVYKEFSRSLVSGLGGDEFGKQLGKRFADMIRGGFTDKEGGEMGKDAANAVADWIGGIKGKVKDWFKKKPPGDGGAGPGNGGDGGPSEPPPPPPLVPAGGREGDAKWFKKEYEGLIESFGDKHATKRREWNDKRLKDQDKAERAAIELTESQQGVGGGPDIEEFARGGKIGKTGLAYVHQDETIVPIAERAGSADATAGAQDMSGPGELKSALDELTEALGRGKALREVPMGADTAGAAQPKPVPVEPVKSRAEAPLKSAGRGEADSPELSPFRMPTHELAGDSSAGLPEVLPADDEPFNLSRAAGRGAAKAASAAARGAGRAAIPAARGAWSAAKGAAGAGMEAAKGFAAESPGMAAALGGGAAALGVVGVAMMAADAVGKVVKGTLGILTTYKDVITSPDTSVTKPIIAFGQLIEKAGEKIPIIGMAGEAIGAFGHVIDNVTKMAEKYGEYSPDISSALAMAEVRQQLGDMERANRIQAEMSEFVMARSDLQAKWEETKIHLLQEALPPLVALMGFTGKILDKINEWLGLDNMPEYNIQDPVDHILGNPAYSQTFNEVTDRGGLMPGEYPNGRANSGRY